MIEKIKKLIEEKQDLNQKDEWGRTLLHEACFHGNVEASKLLIEHGASVIAEGNDCETPLHMACASGSLELVKMLYDCQPHEVFLKAWGNQADTTTETHQTCMGYAATWGHIDVVKFLAENNFRIDQANDDGETPLFMAAQNRHKEVVAYLIDKGANIKAQTGRGETLLSIAVRQNDKDFAEDLLNKGVDINQDVFNVGLLSYRTALSYAVELGRFDMAHFLIEKGANLDKKDCKSTTALSLAVGKYIDPATIQRNEYANLIKHLVEKGADVMPIRQYYDAIVQTRRRFTPPYVVKKASSLGQEGALHQRG